MKWGGRSGPGDRRQAYDDHTNHHVMYTGYRSLLLAYESGMRNNCSHYNQGPGGLWINGKATTVSSETLHIGKPYIVGLPC